MEPPNIEKLGSSWILFWHFPPSKNQLIGAKSERVKSLVERCWRYEKFNTWKEAVEALEDLYQRNMVNLDSLNWTAIYQRRDARDRSALADTPAPYPH